MSAQMCIPRHSCTWISLVNRSRPPRGGGGGGNDGNNGEGASQGSGAALAPTGRSGSMRRGHGRVEGADT